MLEWNSIAFEGGAGWERLENAKEGKRGWRRRCKEEEEEDKKSQHASEGDGRDPEGDDEAVLEAPKSRFVSRE